MAEFNSILPKENFPVVKERGGIISLFGDEVIPFAPAPPTAAPPVIKQKEYLDPQLSNVATVIDLGRNNQLRTVLERKPDVQVLRNFAKSVWVRAAIDFCRRTAGRAKFEIMPGDTTEKLSRRDKQVKAAIEDLLRHPNVSDTSYSEMKEMMLEDYYVIGHGCLELDLNRDLTVRGVKKIDAGRIGFLKEWDGSDYSIPRYCEFEAKNPGQVKRYLAHQQVMCLVNRPVTFSNLGTSHVEILYKTVVALLSGDDFLIKQLLEPIANKMIDLGEDAKPADVEQFKFEIQNVREAIAVIGGSKSTKVHDLTGSAEEMKILDGATWFVRQVAAVFGISTAKLKLAVDTSRANTNAMLDDDIEAVTGELTRIEELEAATFIKPFEYLGDLNLVFFYPIMHRKDERQQAQIARIQTGQPWASPNEARGRTGEKLLDTNEFPYANEILINAGRLGPIPFSLFSKIMSKLETLLDQKPELFLGLNSGDNQPDPNQPKEPKQ